MRYFLDTEFIERGPSYPITLISIGMVAEDGREFYAISSEFQVLDAGEWVLHNVIGHLEPGVERQPLAQIAQGVRAFVGEDPKPEFWGYYADYDWVVFAQLFGSMVDLPGTFPMYCRDIKQMCDDYGNPQLPEQGKGEHNALADARWNQLAWKFLAGLPYGKTKKAL
jgi:hypothetical protein